MVHGEVCLVITVCTSIGLMLRKVVKFYGSLKVILVPTLLWNNLLNSVGHDTLINFALSTTRHVISFTNPQS
jgi:hypothetical protein